MFGFLVVAPIANGILSWVIRVGVSDQKIGRDGWQRVPAARDDAVPPGDRDALFEVRHGRLSWYIYL